MAKSDPKTMRFDVDVEQYIMKFAGDNFSEKFHNLVHYFMKAETDKMKQISMLDLEIKNKEKRLKELSDMLYNTNNLERKFANLKDALDNCKGYLEHFLPREYDKSVNPKKLEPINLSLKK